MVLRAVQARATSKVTYLGPQDAERRLPGQRGSVYSLLTCLDACGLDLPLGIAVEEISRNRGVDSKVVHFSVVAVASSTSIKEWTIVSA